MSRRPTASFVFGRSEFSHSRGFSMDPPAMTTTFASASWVSPVSVSRHRTPRARAGRSFVPGSNRIAVANAFGTIRQLPVATAAGT